MDRVPGEGGTADSSLLISRVGSNPVGKLWEAGSLTSSKTTTSGDTPAVKASFPDEKPAFKAALCDC